MRAHLEGALDSYYSDMVNRQEMARRSKAMYEDVIRSGDYAAFIIPIQGEEHALELIDIEDWIIRDSDRVIKEVEELVVIVKAAPDCETNGVAGSFGGGSEPWLAGHEGS